MPARRRSLSAAFRRGVVAGWALLAAPLPSLVSADPSITPDEGRNASAVVPHAPVDALGDEWKLKLDPSTSPATLHIVLPPPEQDEMKATEQTRGTEPLVVGFHRGVPEEFQGELAPRLEWVAQQDGTFVSVVSVTSPGAEALRVNLRAGPVAGIEMRFFGEESDTRHPPLTAEDFSQEGDDTPVLWSPTVEGDTIGIEIALPSAKAKDAFSLRIEAIAHTTVPAESLESARKLDCPDVHIDVQCRADEIHDALQDAVARIRFEKEGRSYACSGTLMNDKVTSSTVPYFLTANHCVETGTVARSVEAWWFFQHARCGGTTLDSRHPATTLGTDLLATNAQYDLTLLRFRNAPPGGTVLAGWSEEDLDHPVDAYGIHHPSGEEKKYSAGTSAGNFDSDGVVNAIAVTWSEGTTESGSSGSGLFLRNGGHLVGGLSHGPACGYGITDRYGPFRFFYPQVRRWLDSESPTPADDDHGDAPATATLVSSSSLTEGNLERYGDLDYFRIELGASGPLWIYTTGSIDTYGTLTRAGSAYRLTNDDGGTDRNFLIAPRNLPAGTWYLEVRAYDSTDTGVYTLHVASSEPLAPPDHVLPLVTRASNLQLQGLVRVINRSRDAGSVEIHAIDDSGRRFGPVTLSLPAGESKSFSSLDLERGNAALGLSGGVGDGDGDGDWRLELRSDLATEARAYIRTTNGFLTAMDAVAAETAPGSMRYYVPFFNPASNLSLVSTLRLVNLDPRPASVVIAGTDARGDPAPGGSVRLTLPGEGARWLKAEELEKGGHDLTGSLGDGEGKWRLHVSGSRPLQVMGLMRTRSGHLSNLSR